MSERAFDTSALIVQFRKLKPYGTKTIQDAATNADEMILLWETNSTFSPVEIEFLAGVLDPHEMKLAKAFLARFSFVDDRRIIPEDWREAARVAMWISREGTRRQAVDCIIVAIAHRKKVTPISLDKGLMLQHGRSKKG